MLAVVGIQLGRSSRSTEIKESATDLSAPLRQPLGVSMNTFEKGSDLLSKRICAMSGLIMALANIGLHPLLVIPISVVLVALLRK